jgi:hypothetical protein
VADAVTGEQELDPGRAAGHLQTAGGVPQDGVCVGSSGPTTRRAACRTRETTNGSAGRRAILEAFAFLFVVEDYFKVAPNLWKGRLNLDGKTVVGANERAAVLFDRFYPECSQLYRGPRGGLLDGPLDALLIAHFLRTRGSTGMRSIVEKFGKDSIEALAFILGGAKRKRKFGHRLDGIQGV